MVTDCCLRDSSTFIACGLHDRLECESCNWLDVGPPSCSHPQMMGQDKAWALGQVWMMKWNLVGSSLGDSPKESGSPLRTRREITWKKTGGLAARLQEVAGVCRRFDPYPKKISSGCRCASRRRTRQWT
ncbi:hypothetical protein GW17_00018932 [Ensete ventricosum]|nr:hypothetical protein GW17_00018932 [Ensete ventricosum]